MSEMGNVEIEKEEPNKFILLNDLEGNENYLFSKYARYSLASKAGLRGNPKENTLRLEDENGEEIEIYDRVTDFLDFGVGSRLEVNFSTILVDKCFYKILGNDFIEENDLVVDFDKKTIKWPGNGGKTVTGKDLPPGVAQIMYPPNGVINMKRGISSLARPLLLSSEMMRKPEN